MFRLTLLYIILEYCMSHLIVTQHGISQFSVNQMSFNDNYSVKWILLHNSTQQVMPSCH